ncbi:MAG: hypothetical protein LBU85_12310 [Treponema sp.]|jgi:hypothetical protein|nr:hypothetical protein [Treponema sp.]
MKYYILFIALAMAFSLDFYPQENDAPIEHGTETEVSGQLYLFFDNKRKKL